MVAPAPAAAPAAPATSPTSAGYDSGTPTK
jgi:hypothetical protein